MVEDGGKFVRNKDDRHSEKFVFAEQITQRRMPED
jgi:hypothetical protein